MAYEKQTWVTGDIITEEKLNHMEEGIAGASIPFYTPEVIGQHGGEDYYVFFATLDGLDAPVILIKQEDPNDIFKIPVMTNGSDYPMPIPGTWALIAESPAELTEMGPVENKNVGGFYLNEEISSAHLYSYRNEGWIVFMDHIPNIEYFEGEDDPTSPLIT